MKHKSLLVVLFAGLICLSSMSRGEDLATTRQKAEQGNAEAQFNLGVAYFKGKGVPQDHAEAVRWCRLAAEQGHAEAQCDLGLCYATGYGVLQDYKEAMKWYHLAAEQGDVKAQFYLGRVIN